MRTRRSIGPWPQSLALVLFLTGCSSPDPAATLHVAAASNLARLFPDLARACKKSTGLTLVPSLGSTAQLSQQIQNGGPFDLFLAADDTHVQSLNAAGKLTPNSMHNYAQGRLVLFAPRRPDIRALSDLTLPSVKKIGIAKPELAPYGEASVEALKRLSLWSAVEPKVVYGQNISAVRQFVDSSNVDCAFTALALVFDNPGHKLPVDPGLHPPINQTLAIPASTKRPNEAAKAAAWFLSAEARSLFTASGYLVATQDADSAASQTRGKERP